MIAIGAPRVTLTARAVDTGGATDAAIRTPQYAGGRGGDTRAR